MKWAAVLVAAVWLALLPAAVTAQSFQPSKMAGGSQYGVRIPMKIAGCYAPVASNLLASDEDDHAAPGRNSPTKAWDWSATVGSPIFSICPGTVTKVRASPGITEGGYGWHIIVDHGEFESLYAHCRENSFRVQVGQQVTANTQLCQVGLTGITSWPHVHLNITRGGQWNYTRVGEWFNRQLMAYCKFCDATNDPAAPVINGDGSQITANAGTVANQQPATVATTRLEAIRAAVGRLGAETVSMLIMAVLGLLCVVWWLGGLYERVAVVALVISSVVVGVGLWLVMPMGAVQAGQGTVIGGSAAWEWAYTAIQQQEGWKCTDDGAYTMGGVTQATFNRWRAKTGQPTGDVCRLLTRDEAKRIYHELFWKPAGGDTLPAAVALNVVDHFINTGRYKFLLDQCGTDVACISRVRAVDYRSMRNFNIYGAAYLNRVKRIATYIEKGYQQ